MMMEDMYEKVLWEGYGLKFRGGTRTRTGLVCRTDQGLWELKKSRGSAESLRLAFAVKAQLQKNGFYNISQMRQALDGEPFYRQEGVLYFLEAPMPPQVLEEDGTAAFVKGAETLGRMHAAVRGLPSDAAKWETDRLPRLYAKRRRELAKIRRRNDKRGGYDAIDLLLLQYYDQYMTQAAEAEALLREGGYGEAVERAAAQGAFCHNAYKGEALRLDANGMVFVGNFDKCSAELPLADVAAYLRRYVKKTGGDAAGVRAMLECYAAHCPLSAKDRTLLQGMLVYPEKFLRLINEYYNKRRTCVSPAMQERLAAAARDEANGVRLREMLCKGC